MHRSAQKLKAMALAESQEVAAINGHTVFSWMQGTADRKGGTAAFRKTFMALVFDGEVSFFKFYFS